MVEKAATDANDATAGDSGGPKSGSGNGGDGGDATDRGIALGELSFDSWGYYVHYFSPCHSSLPSSCDDEGLK